MQPQSENTEGQLAQKKLQTRLSLVFGIIGLLFGALFLIFGLRDYLYPDREMKNLSVTEINGVISKAPEIRSPGRGEHLVFEFANYPEVQFEVVGLAYSSLSGSITGSITNGDSVYLLVDDYNHEKLLASTRGHLSDQKFISVCGFRDKKTVYLLLSDYKTAHIRDYKLGIIGAFSGLFLIVFYSRALYRWNLKG